MDIIDDFLKLVSDFFGLGHGQLRCGRDKNAVTARHYSWFYLHDYLNTPTSKLAAYFQISRRGIFKGVAQLRWLTAHHKAYIDLHKAFCAAFQEKSGR